MTHEPNFNIMELVGKRCLLRLGAGNDTWRSDGFGEYRVIEVSPSKKWIKLMDRNASKFWRDSKEVHLVETLIDTKEVEPRPTT